MKEKKQFTLLRLLSYYKPYLFFFLTALICASLMGVSNLLATYRSGFVTNNLLDYGKAFQEGGDLALIAPDYTTVIYRDIGIVVALYVLVVLFSIYQCEVMAFLAQKVLYQLRKELFSKMQSLPFSYFDKRGKGDIMSLYTNDIDSIIVCLNDSISNIVLSATNMVGTIVFLFVINVYLSLIVVFFIALMFLFMFLNARASRKYYQMQQVKLAEVNERVEEDIKGVKVIKAFSHEKESFEKFDETNRSWRDAATQAFFHSQLNTPFFVSLSYLNFSISAVLGVIGLATSVFGPLKFGQLQSYLVFTRNACQPFNFFTMHLNSILSATAGAKRIFSFLDEENEIDEGEYKLKVVDNNADAFCKKYAWSNGKDIIPLKGEISFSHVTFSYSPEKRVLNDISFEVKPGEKIAFVGSTGAGKTTIISLLARFYPLDSGRITYDGIDVNDIELDSLRKALSMVTQDTHLFTDTVRENLRYTRRHSTEEEVKKAAKDSHADSFIKRLPSGYDTILYDDGGNLSEGQRQLLGITRASLNNPPVMILDEATSNIDTRSEMLIQKDLTAMMKGKAVIVIAHRLSTIQDSTRIYVLEKGEIREKGTQEELLKIKGAYYDLYTGKVELS